MVWEQQNPSHSAENQVKIHITVRRLKRGWPAEKLTVEDKFQSKREAEHLV